MGIWTTVDLFASLLVLIILGSIWHYHFRTRPERRMWRCERWHGGGSLVTPRPMTVEEVTQWLARDNNAEIGYIDHDHGFVFYRPKGGAP